MTKPDDSNPATDAARDKGPNTAGRKRRRLNQKAVTRVLFSEAAEDWAAVAEDVDVEPAAETGSSDHHDREPDEEAVGASQERGAESDAGMSPGQASAFDEVRAGFLSRFSRSGLRSFMFCGTAENDGASTTVANLAKSLALDSDLKLLLIDADLKRPSLASHFAFDDGAVLDNMLKGIRLEHAASTAIAREVTTMPGSVPRGNPFSIFQSRRFESFLHDATARYDYVLFDGPPLTKSPESLVLAGKVDAVILVLRANETPKLTAQAAISKVERAGGKVAGVILNRRKYYIPDWLYKLL